MNVNFRLIAAHLITSFLLISCASLIPNVLNTSKVVTNLSYLNAGFDTAVLNIEQGLSKMSPEAQEKLPKIRDRLNTARKALNEAIDREGGVAGVLRNIQFINMFGASVVDDYVEARDLYLIDKDKFSATVQAQLKLFDQNAVAFYDAVKAIKDDPSNEQALAILDLAINAGNATMTILQALGRV